MQFLGTYSQFKTVAEWNNGPKKPTVVSASGNASDITTLISNLNSDISNLGDGETISLTVQAFNTTV